MAVYFYNNEWSPVSVVVGDDVFAAINALPNSNLMANADGLTTYGAQVLNAFPCDVVSGMIALREDATQLDDNKYNLLTTYFPRIGLKRVPVPGTSEENRFFRMTGHLVKRVRVRTRVPTNNLTYGLVWAGQMEMQYGARYWRNPNGTVPIGEYRPAIATGTNENAFMDIGFLYCDSAMQQWGYVEIVCGSNAVYQLQFYHTRITNETDRIFLTEFFDGVTPAYEDKDPFAPGGNTGDDNTGGTGGTGNFDGTGDNIEIPSLPTLSAVDTGFITLFNPSGSELKALANYMWSTGFDLNTFKKIFADPMDCILGLSIVPVNVPSGGSRVISVGNISTGVSMTVASTQYVEVDCGTLNVQEFWGAYLDYDPYTKAEIYLPYIGTHPIATDDIMGKAVHVVYHIDVLSGACTAFVKCGGSVLYEFIGQCSSSIPITGNDWTNVINGVISIAGAIGSMVATGGASAPLATSAIASSAANSMKPNVEKSGSMSGTGGMLAVQVPYLILTRPRQALPADQNSFTGYPSFITRYMSSLQGYTEIDSVHLDGIDATKEELIEIEALLKSGVIF